MPVRLEVVTPALAMAYRDVRLRSLQESPAAFGRSHSEEAAFPEAEWHRRTAMSDGVSAIVFLALDAAETVGLVRCNLDDKHPSDAHITAMWVAPSARGTTLGRDLLQAAQSWAQGCGARQLLLMVVDSNGRATRFYEKCGFTMTGRSESYPRNPERLQLEMSKQLF